ncbi:hypothetical protein JCM8208_003617 [Rhodotorula glutinis]
MSTRLMSSTRAVLAAATRSAAVLDVLAPATISSHLLYSSKPAMTSAPPAEPAASSSKVRLDSTSSRSRGPSGPANGPRGASTTSSRPPTAHARPNKPPPAPSSSSRTAPRRASAPSASDLLSEMRSSSSSRPPRPGRAKSASQKALWELQQALTGKRRDFVRALNQGWLPLCAARQVSRIAPDDLAKLLQAVANGVKMYPAAEGTSWRWADVCELVVYAAGERDQRPVGEWAWKTLELGWAGAGRVAEVWEAVRAGEHRALRSGPDALSANFTPPSAEFASSSSSAPSSSTAADSKPPAPLFAAAVVARALLRARTPAAEREPFSALVAQWADSHVPLLQSLVTRGTAQSLIERHISPASFPLSTSSSSSSPSTPPSTADLVATLRQVVLAQTYYARMHAPGLEVLAVARDIFRTGRAADAWALWGDVRRAVEGDEAWMGTAGWEKSGRERRYRALAAEDVETVNGEVGVVAPADPRPLPPATLHQPVVSTLIAGFVQAQAPDRANAIWAWLLSRSPPLTPGLSCWTGLLHGYAARGEVQAVESAFAELQRTGPAPDVWAWLERVDAHFAARKPDEAMRLARVMMRDRDVVRALGEGDGDGALPEEAWNRLQVGLLSNGRRLEAEALLDEMRTAGVPPSIVTVNGFLKSYTRGSKPDLAAVVRVLKLVTEHGLEPNVYTFTMVLQTLLAGGLKDATARTIAIMEQAKVKPTATTYGAIIHDLVQGSPSSGGGGGGGGKREQLEAAVQLLDEMEAKRIPATEVIYSSLIQGFLSAIPSTPLAGAPPASPVGVASSLDAASRAQHPYMVAALTLKQRMEKRGLRLNRVGYNAFLSAALALQSEWGTEFALHLFSTMQRERAALAKASTSSSSSSSGDEDEDPAASSQGSAPSDTWYVLLDGFVRMGDFGRADAVVQEMQRQGFEVRNRGLQRLVSQVVRGRP